MPTVEKVPIVSRTEAQEQQREGSPSKVPYKSSAPIAVGSSAEVEFGIRIEEKEISTSLLSPRGHPDNFQPNSNSDSLSEADASPVSPKVDTLIFEDEGEDLQTELESLKPPTLDSREEWEARKQEEGAKEERHATTCGGRPGSPSVSRHAVEYVFDVEEMGIAKGKSFCIQRPFEAFGFPWRLSFERTTTAGYIGLCLERLDSRLDVLQVSASFECTVTGSAFSTKLQQPMGPRGRIVDPYFLCPQRQKRFLALEKYLGLSVLLRLV